MTRCSCAMPTCNRTTYNSTELTFFRFPRDPDRFVQWAVICRRSDIMNNLGGCYFLCELHFEESQLIRVDKKVTLKRYSMPVRNIPAEDLNFTGKQGKKTNNAKLDGKIIVKSESYSEATEDNPPIPSTSKEKTVKTKPKGKNGNDKLLKIQNKAKFKKKTPPASLLKTQNQATFEKKTQPKGKNSNAQLLKAQNQAIFEKLCDEFLPPDIARYIKLQLQFKSHFQYQTFYHHKLKFYLQLYHADPSVYEALAKTMGLPRKSELAKYYAPVFTMNHKTAVEAFKVKVQSMKENEKICSLIIRRVPIKPFLFYDKNEDKIYGFHEVNERQTTQVAKYATIASVRGIYKDWYMPFSYALFSEKNHWDISIWFKNVLLQLFATGLHVIVCISNIIPQLDVSVSPFQPFFTYYDRKIFFMYNPDYLMYQVKRLLMRFQLHFKGLETNWEHVSQFYEMDSKKQFRLAPNLTDKHMDGGCKPQAKCITAQLLSEEVAAGISTYVDFGQIPESARGTVQFISVMAKLRDCFHSTNKTQGNIIKVVYEIFSELKIFKDGVDITSTVLLIQKIIITLRSIQILNSNLKDVQLSGLPLTFLSMSILNKMVMKLQKKTKDRRITSLSLICAYRKKFFDEIMKSNLSHSKELPRVLANYFQWKSMVNEKVVIRKPTTEPLTANKYKVNMPQKHQFLFVCGFVLKKVFELHQECLNMHRIVTFDESDEDRFSIYLEYREVCTGTNSCELDMIPPDTVVVFLQKVEAEIQILFKTELMIQDEAKEIFARLKKKTESIKIQTPPACPCFPEYYLRKLYIQIRLDHLVSMNNKDYTTDPSNEATFRVKYFV